MGLTCSVPAVDMIRKYTGSDQEMNYASTVEEFDLNVYSSERFQEKISASKIISVPNHIYVNAIMASAKPETRLVIKTCFFSENSDVSDTNDVDYIFENSCPANPDTHVFQNGDNYAASFSAKSVSLGDDVKMVYLHCYAEFCDSSADSCEPSCGVRKRRQADSRPGVWKTAGPFKFTTAKQCRYDGQTVCGANSECLQLQDSIKCSCRNGYEPHPYDAFGCIVSETSDMSSTENLLVLGGGRLIKTRKTAFGLSRK